MRRRRCSDAGWVGVEYVIIVVPVLLFFFCTFQLFLLYIGRHLARHAAVSAARAAVVVLDDDPRYYGGETRNELVEGGERIAHIRRAAKVPLLPAVPHWETHVGRYEEYVRAAVAVSFPAGPRAREQRSNYGLNDDVTVRATFLYECAVPMAFLIMCDTLEDIREDGAISEELDRVEDVGAQWAIAEGGARFNVFRAEATLPNHGARYEYPGEGE